MDEFGETSVIDEMGKEYIAKCVGIQNVMENLISSVANSIFIAKSTLNLIKPEIEVIYDDSITSREILTYIDILKDNAGDIERAGKEAKIKLQKTSHMSLGVKGDPEVKEKHIETFNSFYRTMEDIIENLIGSSIDNLFDELKRIHPMISKKEPVNTLLKWHASVFRSLSDALRLLRVATKRTMAIKKHVEEYRKNLINNIKTQHILDEVKKTRPISLMRVGGKIKTDELSAGNIFSHSLYTDDSKLIKEAYDPFTEKEIISLKNNNINFLYKHNNIDKHLNPSDYHIAIVDDDKAFTDLVCEQLEDINFKTEVYNDAEKAIKEVVTTVPDLILLDIKMPGLNGIDFLKSIYDQEKNNLKIVIPVIMATSWANEKLIKECLNLGAYDFIVKPFSTDDLLVKITSYLNLKKQK